ncbi:hypothetical protein EON65_04680 [archaeon]|nr:MAG: hypothetical protein EON65_04680 [archaeon]
MESGKSEAAAWQFYEFLQKRQHQSFSEEVLKDIADQAVHMLQTTPDKKIYELLKSFGWKDGAGFSSTLDIEGLLIAIRRSQINASFLRASMVINANVSHCFVPEVLIKHLSSKIQNQDIEITPHAEFFFAACLLVDISGFTKLSGYYCAQGSDGIDELQKRINGYLGELAAVIYSLGGDVLKYAGDAVLCIFPCAPEDKSGAISALVKNVQSSNFGNNIGSEGEKADVEATANGSPSVSPHFSPVSPRRKSKKSVSAPPSGYIACMQAIKCAMSLKDISTDDLSVHIGVTCGEVCFGVLGGYDDKWDCLVSGPCLMDLSQCLDDAKSKQVVITPELHCMMKVTDKEQFRIEELESCNFLIQDTDTSAAPIIPAIPTGASPSTNKKRSFLLPGQDQNAANQYLLSSPIFNALLRKFVPLPVNQHLTAQTQDLSQLAELREVCTLFMKWQSYDYEKHTNLLSLQELFYGAQEIIHKWGGFIRQFLVDDKGCVLIALWGVPSASHIDNSVRAVSCAAQLGNIFRAKDFEISIGITTGKVFTGTVGSVLRKEYAAIGDSVNMAARLMCKANNEIFLGSVTANNLLASNKSLYNSLLRSMGKFKMKGKAEPLEVFCFTAINTESNASQRNTKGRSTTSNWRYIRPQVKQAIIHMLDAPFSFTSLIPSLSDEIIQSFTPHAESATPGIGKLEVPKVDMASGDPPVTPGGKYSREAVGGGTINEQPKLSDTIGLQSPSTNSSKAFLSAFMSPKKMSFTSGLSMSFRSSGRVRPAASGSDSPSSSPASARDGSINASQSSRLKTLPTVSGSADGTEVGGEKESAKGDREIYVLRKHWYGIGQHIVIESKHDYEVSNTINWLKTEVSCRDNVSIHHIVVREEDIDLPLELWRKMFVGILGEEICSSSTKLEEYFHPVLQAMHLTRRDLFASEEVIQLLESVFHITSPLVYNIPLYLAGHIVLQLFLCVIKEEQKKHDSKHVLIIQNLHHVHEVSLKVLYQSRVVDQNGMTVTAATAGEDVKCVEISKDLVQSLLFVCTSAYVQDIKNNQSVRSSLFDNSSNPKMRFSIFGAIRGAMTNGAGGSGGSGGQLSDRLGGSLSDFTDEDKEYFVPVWLRSVMKKLLCIRTLALDNYTPDDILSMLSDIYAVERTEKSASSSNLIMSPKASKQRESLKTELSSFIFQLSDGDPFWVEEFLSFVVEVGVDSFLKTMQKGSKEAALNSPRSKLVRIADDIPDKPIMSPLLRGMSCGLNVAESFLVHSDTYDEDDYATHLSKLESFILTRLERLSSDCQIILRTASILGYKFSRHVLYGVLRRKLRNKMTVALQELVQKKWLSKIANTSAVSSEDKEFLSVSSEVSDFKFNHVLFQSTLYQLTPASERKEIHKKATACLLDVYGDTYRIYLDLVDHYATYQLDQAFAFTIKFVDYYVARISQHMEGTVTDSELNLSHELHSNMVLCIKYLHIALNFTTHLVELDVLRAFHKAMGELAKDIHATATSPPPLSYQSQRVRSAAEGAEVRAAAPIATSAGRRNWLNKLVPAVHMIMSLNRNRVQPIEEEHQSVNEPSAGTSRNATKLSRNSSLRKANSSKSFAQAIMTRQSSNRSKTSAGGNEDNNLLSLLGDVEINMTKKREALVKQTVGMIAEEGGEEEEDSGDQFTPSLDWANTLKSGIYKRLPDL